MALKALMLRRSIENKKAALTQLRAKDADFQRREQELEQAINEAATAEDEAAVTAEIETFESDRSAHNTAVADAEAEINRLEQELAAEEAGQPGPAPTTPTTTTTPTTEHERNDNHMSTRTFYGMNHQERDAFFARQEVKDLLANVRTAIREKRAITNAGLLIPEIVLPLIRQAIEENSKLLRRVTLHRVGGTARATIMGEIPEAVWTEMCAKLNELDLSFAGIEFDGYKVGGFFAICNAILEDSDINLMSELISALGKAIGKALDRAIVYGTGKKMPIGIVTRLAQETQPENYSPTARKWVDLHTTHMLTGTGAAGLKLFQEIAGAAGVVSNDYYKDGMAWLMNEKTKTKLMIQSMGINANAAIVSGINNTMPVIGGDIVTLGFVPDDNIVFGYLPAYGLAERSGTQIETSREVRIIEGQTVLVGSARYDGKPQIAEAFGVLTISSEAPTKTVTFPQDTANGG